MSDTPLTSPEPGVPLEQKMARALKGDKAAYADVLRTISRQLAIFLNKKLPPKDRDDVIQEILLSVHKARATYDSTRPLMPWVMAIARYRLHDYWRQHYGHAGHETVNVEDMKNILAHDPTKKLESSEDIRGILKKLSPRQQEVMNLMYGHDKTVQEIAEALKMSASAVKVTAFRSYQVFRQQMKD